MTSLTVTAPVAAVSTAAAPPVFGPRIIIGLVGVLLAVLVSGLNEMVTKVALADIRGALASATTKAPGWWPVTPRLP